MYYPPLSPIRAKCGLRNYKPCIIDGIKTISMFKCVNRKLALKTLMDETRKNLSALRPPPLCPKFDPTINGMVVEKLKRSVRFLHLGHVMASDFYFRRNRDPEY